MDQKDALGLSFTVKKHWLVSMGQSDSQPKSRSLQKRGPRPFDHNHVTMVNWGLARRKAHLILPDILRTELGKAHIDKIKFQEAVNKKKTEATNALKHATTREIQDQRIEKTPKGREGRTSSTPQRSRVLRKLQNVDKEEEDESKDNLEMIVGKDKEADCKFADVVDCGLSFSWNSAKDSADCENLDPVGNKEVEIDPQNDAQQTPRRKRKEINSRCNGTSSSKRLRESVLCLTEERETNGRPAADHVEDGEDCRVPDMMRCSEEDRADVLPLASGESRTGGRIMSPKHRRFSSPVKTSPCPPITLSSDEEDFVTVPELSSTEVRETSGVQDVQVIPIVEGALAVGKASVVDHCSMRISFTLLHCGGYLAKSNGELLVEKEKIIIPVTDVDKQRNGKLTLERKELMRYGVWDLDDASQLDGTRIGEDFPANALLFYVSKEAAITITQELRNVCVRRKSTTTGDGVSPFILLTFEEPLRGMEGALLRSSLELDCLNCMVSEKHSHLTDFRNMPRTLLSLENTLDLLQQTGLDPHLLAVLGVDTTDTHSGTSASTDPEQEVEALEAPELRTEVLGEIIPELEKVPLLDTSVSGCVVELPLGNEGSSPVKRQENSNATRGPGEVAELNTAQMQQQCSTLEWEMNVYEGLETEMETVIHAAPELETTAAHCPVLETGLEQEMSPAYAAATEAEIDPETEDEAMEPLSEDEDKPVYTLCHRRVKGSYRVSMCKLDSSWTKYKHHGLSRRLIQFPPPPIKGGITVTMEDLQCLDSGQYLNDVIIDFYLKYLLQMSAPAMVERSHIFSSFFYKQLTRRDNASEGNTSETCQRQRRHQRVKTWTRHIDIFNKDFVFVPVNQEAHWYLVVICFPGLDEVTYEAHPRASEWPSGSDHNGTTEEPDEAQNSKTFSRRTSVDGSSEPGGVKDPKIKIPGPVMCTEETCRRKMVCKRPCILIMDSLKFSLHERVFKLIREYLQSEWEARRGTSRDFGPDQMKSSHSQVPLQDNSSDCGLYLLQYVESFLKDPVVHFELPLQLQRWFPRHQVRRKRDQIRDLVLKLYRDQNLDSQR
ncbi:sentrin-specific protease 7 isoform X2 [Synchiropus splendidus]|uniref:sentrin-specific protease 7 isoform X2 n=1 Tax=Synchiropus splendidus TaxID=270530 RepID=UPI00237D815F|nr:sentrin-specific protease 7 isoform X2 [Synchiropus splendidus]